MLRPSRARERVAYELELIRAVLDEALFCHVGVVVEGRPHVLPTMHARIGDRVYLHASSAARIITMARAESLPVCVTVSLLDGIVLARSAFHHSLNYRSVVIHGEARLVSEGEEVSRALAAFVDRAGEGRSGQCRPPSRRELAATAVLVVDLAEEATDVASKSRTGPPNDDEADLELGYWAGVVPLQITAGAAQPDCTEPVPAGLAPFLPQAAP